MTDAQQRYPHPPAHPAAVADGCTCPVLDNANGRGCGFLSEDGEPVFIVNLKCPRHGSASQFPEGMTFGRDLSGPAYGAAARLDERVA